MVILLARNGQLCNRLFIISAFVANSLEHGYALVSDSFDDYLDRFEGINDAGLRYNIRVLTTRQITERMCYKAISKIAYSNGILSRCLGVRGWRNNGDINTRSFIEMAKEYRLVVRGWPFWDVANFIKHSSTIKEIFAPRKKYVINAVNFLRDKRERFDIIIGVHIRRGDYINHLNGRFFFSIAVYQDKLQELYNQVLLTGKTAAFIICSNESIDKDWNVGFPYFPTSMDGMSDLVILSMCDYIVGPPSTYSMWASFYGNVPYNNFFSADDYLPLDSFSPIVAPSTFANGRVLIDVYETYSA